LVVRKREGRSRATLPWGGGGRGQVSNNKRLRVGTQLVKKKIGKKKKKFSTLNHIELEIEVIIIAVCFLKQYFFLQK
jgi:hypothetical protein